MTGGMRSPPLRTWNRMSRKCWNCSGVVDRVGLVGLVGLVAALVDHVALDRDDRGSRPGCARWRGTGAGGPWRCHRSLAAIGAVPWSRASYSTTASHMVTALSARTYFVVTASRSTGERLAVEAHQVVLVRRTACERPLRMCFGRYRRQISSGQLAAAWLTVGTKSSMTIGVRYAALRGESDTTAVSIR